jgi:hypothetical protein
MYDLCTGPRALCESCSHPGQSSHHAGSHIHILKNAKSGHWENISQFHSFGHYFDMMIFSRRG